MPVINLDAKNPKKIADVLRKLQKATSATIARATGKPKNTVTTALKALIDAGKIHIGDWEINSRGQMTRIYYWGRGIDAREPMIAGKEKVHFIPRPDEAAAWLRNPI